MILASKALLATVAFTVLLFLAVLTTTLIVQGDQHPDNWVITAYDIAAMVVVAAIYIATLAHMLKKFFKEGKHSNE